MISQIGDVLPFMGLNTHASLILVYLGGAMGINIWLMKGYLDTIPRDIDESAMVEGATDWQIFTRLILPLLRPILIVIGIINYIGTYSEFVLARVLLKSADQYTLMVGLERFRWCTISTTMGSICGRCVDRRAADHDHLPPPPGPDCGWPDSRRGERVDRFCHIGGIRIPRFNALYPTGDF